MTNTTSVVWITVGLLILILLLAWVNDPMLF
jgi:hypothetical protein